MNSERVTLQMIEEIISKQNNERWGLSRERKNKRMKDRMKEIDENEETENTEEGVGTDQDESQEELAQKAV
ncbi:MAG: hypothetical protein M1830_002633, partial [Pleopsidium flavum]